MKRNLLGVFVFALALIFGQTAFSWQCGEGMHKMVEKMKLDETQKSKIKPILEQMKADLKTSGSQMKDLHNQVSQQIQSDSMDQAALDGLIDKKAKLVGDMMKAKANAKHQIYMLLTPQQKTAFQDMSKKFEEKMAAQWEKCKAENKDDE